MEISVTGTVARMIDRRNKKRSVWFYSNGWFGGLEAVGGFEAFVGFEKIRLLTMN